MCFKDFLKINYFTKQAKENEKRFINQRNASVRKNLNDKSSIEAELVLKKQNRILKLQQMFKIGRAKECKTEATVAFSKDLIKCFVQTTEENKEFLLDSLGISNIDLKRCLIYLKESNSLAQTIIKERESKEQYRNFKSLRKITQYRTVETEEVESDTSNLNLSYDGMDSFETSKSCDLSTISKFETKIEGLYKKSNKFKVMLKYIEKADLKHKTKKIMRDICIKMVEKMKLQINNVIQKKQNEKDMGF